jgi:hypothetical protein
MTADDHALLEVIEADYRSNHMYWIERKLNKRFERWFRNRTSYEIKICLLNGKSMICKSKFLPITTSSIMNR